MLKILSRSKDNVVGLKLSGKIKPKDYRTILIPTFNQVIAEHGKARALLEFADDFAGYELKTLFMDARYGLKHMKQFEKCAVVNAPMWAIFLIKVIDKTTKCKSRAFNKDEIDEAWGWIEG